MPAILLCSSFWSPSGVLERHFAPLQCSFSKQIYSSTQASRYLIGAASNNLPRIIKTHEIAMTQQWECDMKHWCGNVYVISSSFFFCKRSCPVISTYHRCTSKRLSKLSSREKRRRVLRTPPSFCLSKWSVASSHESFYLALRPLHSIQPLS